MASNAASSVQFRVNGTEMARGRARKTERSQSMDPRAKPRAAGRLKGKRRDNRDERESILGPENAGNFCIAREGETMRKCAETCRQCAATCAEVAQAGPIRRA